MTSKALAAAAALFLTAGAAHAAAEMKPCCVEMAECCKEHKECCKDHEHRAERDVQQQGDAHAGHQGHR